MWAYLTGEGEKEGGMKGGMKGEWERERGLEGE